MKKIKLDDSDKLILKSFLKRGDAEYIKNLDLRYEMDYYGANAKKILDKSEKLNVKLSHWNKSTERRIKQYLEKSNNVDDLIFFHLLEATYLIFCKYYNKDGTIKED